MHPIPFYLTALLKAAPRGGPACSRAVSRGAPDVAHQRSDSVVRQSAYRSDAITVSQILTKCNLSLPADGVKLLWSHWLIISTAGKTAGLGRSGGTLRYVRPGNKNYSLISPAHLKANFATITAIISLIIAAATIVPDTIEAREASIAVKVVTAIPVNTKDTPE